MAYQGIIFDLDGTLLDTVEDIADSVNHVLEEFGMEPRNLKDYHQLVGAGLDQLLIDLLGEKVNDKAFYEPFKKRVKAIYQQRWHVKSRPYPGIHELLDHLKAKELPRSVLSNKYQEGTTAIVNHFFSKWALNPIMGARDGIPLKPDPTAALEIARQKNLPPEYWLYVGDTPSDIQMALRAGMLPVGVKWGFRPEEELTKAGAKNFLAHPEDLLAYLG